jgi:3-(3-hydroxy-phenyl)propionate hydroxylase
MTSAPPAPSYAATAYRNGYEFAHGSAYQLPRYPFVVPPELTSGTQRHPVVIVGGGLSGLTLACALARLGQPAVLLDEDDTVGVRGASSRGICYTQKSLEIFHRLGVFERIAARGIQWSVGRTFAGNDEVYAFDLRQQGGFSLSAQPPFINIQQFYVEGFLVERIAELGHIDLRWQSRVVGFTQHEGYATLAVDTPAGQYTLDAAHVIDATGAHSPFHAWCGVEKTAQQGDDRWCIADVRFDQHPPVERHTWIEAPFNDNRAVWQHLMADDVWRIDYQMLPDSDPKDISREEVVRERLRRQFGPDTKFEIVWVGPYAYRSQYLHTLRHGSVFFLGDAAKVVSPFGARGGNTGISDADNLAWKLAAVLKGQAAPGLLNSYDEERSEAARQNVLVTSRTTRFLRPSTAAERLFRGAAIALAKQYPFARQLVNTGRMAVANSYSHTSVCADGGGQSVQNVAFLWADGSGGVVNELLGWAGSRLLLLVFGSQPASALQRLRQLSLHAPLVCLQVPEGNTPAQACEHVRDPQGHLKTACQVFGHSWALLRPDGYLAASGEAVDGELVAAVEKALALSS